MKKSKSFNGTPATSPGLKGIKYKISGLVQRDYRVLNMKRSAPTDYIVNNTKHTHTALDLQTISAQGHLRTMSYRGI